MFINQPTYGIIGNPVKHSLSPLMHNAAFKELGVDAAYKLFPLNENEINEFFTELRKKDNPIFGLNVTVPYKETVVPFMDSMNPFAVTVRAVNTIVISNDRKFYGYNTDGPGFLTHLTELGFNPKNKRVAILGAGGSARAIICALCLLPEQCESIKIYTRTRERAIQLIADLKERLNLTKVESVDSIDDLNIEISDLLINTTPLGLNEDDPCLVDESLINPNILVYDAVYNPAETKLLKLAKSKGAKTANGLGMLFYQGVLSFQHWAHIELSDEVKNVMRQNLQQGVS